MSLRIVTAEQFDHGFRVGFAASVAVSAAALALAMMTNTLPAITLVAGAVASIALDLFRARRHRTRMKAIRFIEGEYLTEAELDHAAESLHEIGSI